MNELVINAEGPEVRVAVLENGQTVEVIIERQRERSIVGNIYKGRVSRVLPGMQAAFVDIGTDKSAFLYVGEVRGGPDDVKNLFGEGEDEDERERPGKKEGEGRGPRIEDLLKAGQDIIVQIAKAPMGSKGSRSTSYLSLPGRNLVFLPTINHLGISRRIVSEKERKRLRSVVESMRPEGAGLIVRTVAEGVSEADLRADMEYLLRLWTSLKKKSESVKAPALLYNDLDLLLRTVRDQFTGEVERLVIDSKTEHERLVKFVSAFMPEYLSKIELYQGEDPIFDYYNIESEIDRALERKVYLKSGGTLVIEQREALTTIDVNTGKFVGKKNLEETITKTNLEACKEVSDQLRLRNLGGIVIVDFIDMNDEENRNKVMHAFTERLKRDKAKTNISQLSELGLLEMTRKRTRESLLRSLTEPCSACDGKGYVKSKISICYEVLRQLKRQGRLHKEEELELQVHPEVAELLATVDQKYLEDLEKEIGKHIVIHPRQDYPIEKFQIKAKKS